MPWYDRIGVGVKSDGGGTLTWICRVELEMRHLPHADTVEQHRRSPEHLGTHS